MVNYLLTGYQNTSIPKVPLDGDKVEPRHSHSACHWGRSVVLAGGLGENLVPLSTVQVVETQVSTCRDH